MKINNLFLILLLSSLIFTQVKKYRTTPDQNRKLRQARSLYNNGLTEQAENIYYELFKQSPYLIEAFKPLKQILKNNENWELLSEIFSIYMKNNGNSNLGLCFINFSTSCIQLFSNLFNIYILENSNNCVIVSIFI